MVRVSLAGRRIPPSVALAMAAHEGLDALMIDFRFTAKNLDWRVVAVVAGFVLAVILVFSGQADAVLLLAGELLREVAIR
jgi:hypothetical protein